MNLLHCDTDRPHISLTAAADTLYLPEYHWCPSVVKRQIKPSFHILSIILGNSDIGIGLAISWLKWGLHFILSPALSDITITTFQEAVIK